MSSAKLYFHVFFSPLADSLNVKSGTLFYPNWVTGHGGFVKKIGRIAHCSIVFNANTDVYETTEPYHFCTLPENFRPLDYFWFDHPILGLVEINTNGVTTFKFNKEFSTVNWMNVYLSFITSN